MAVADFLVRIDQLGALDQEELQGGRHEMAEAKEAQAHRTRHVAV